MRAFIWDTFILETMLIFRNHSENTNSGVSCYPAVLSFTVHAHACGSDALCRFLPSKYCKHSCGFAPLLWPHLWAHNTGGLALSFRRSACHAPLSITQSCILINRCRRSHPMCSGIPSAPIWPTPVWTWKACNIWWVTPMRESPWMSIPMQVMTTQSSRCRKYYSSNCRERRLSRVDTQTLIYTKFTPISRKVTWIYTNLWNLKLFKKFGFLTNNRL